LVFFVGLSNTQHFKVPAQATIDFFYAVALNSERRLRSRRSTLRLSPWVFSGQGMRSPRETRDAGEGRTRMGANSTQALGVAAFLLGFTTLAVGIVRGGIIYYLLAVALVGISIAVFLKCKPLENAEN
jgi:hypothetical protein